MHLSPFAIAALVCAAISAAIIVGYLVVRPAFGPATKIVLLLGLGVFPIAAAGIGNVEGFEATKDRQFCGACHVMGLHTADASDPTSGSLASRHSRNKLFGTQSCYSCHADYGMFGTIVTKLGGMRHVYYYYFTDYHSMSMDDAKKKIHLRQPYPNDNCMQCHSTQDTLWQRVPDHKSALDAVRSDQVSCASAGCHGLAHPFFRTPDEIAAAPVHGEMQ